MAHRVEVVPSRAIEERAIGTYIPSYNHGNHHTALALGPCSNTDIIKERHEDRHLYRNLIRSSL